jgi:hypothetical protein
VSDPWRASEEGPVIGSLPTTDDAGKAVTIDDNGQVAFSDSVGPIRVQKTLTVPTIADGLADDVSTGAIPEFAGLAGYFYQAILRDNTNGSDIIIGIIQADNGPTAPNTNGGLSIRIISTPGGTSETAHEFLLLAWPPVS